MVEIMHNEEATEASVLKTITMSLSDLNKEVMNTPPKINLRKPPIVLGYKEIYKEKDVAINLPNEYSVQGRILRCMRWKAATDAAEAKYDIPSGLLLAMMAQEGMGDPTQPNGSGDGGLGLIHIQAKNAADFGLDTLPRFTEGMQDFKHGALITDKLKKTKDVKQLISFDERFHPIMSIDCAARFLRNSYNAMHVGKNGDGRINVLRSYSGRGWDDYLLPVLKYWVLVNTYTNKSLPLNDFSANTLKIVTQMQTSKIVTFTSKAKKKDGKFVTVTNNIPTNIVQTSAQKLSISLDGVPCTYEQYLLYNTGQLVNYGLNEYIAAQPKLIEPKIVKLKAKEENVDGITNLNYIGEGKDKDNKRKEYSFILPSIDKMSTSLPEFLTNIKLFDKFHDKKIDLTDEDRNILTPLTYPIKPGTRFLIREYLPKKT